MTRLTHIATIAALLAAAPALARPWKSADGERTIEAEFVKLEGDQITLRKPDGETITFPTDKLSPEDKAFALNESRKPKTILKEVFGKSGQAFDNLMFGQKKDAIDAALASSKHVENEGGSVSFFGQSTKVNEFVAGIDGERYKIIALYDKGQRLVELQILGRPNGWDRVGPVTSDCRELHTRLDAAFGKASEEFQFPDILALKDKESGVTHRWDLSGGRKLYLAIQRHKESLNVIMRITK